MKISFIATVYNESKNIHIFLNSILSQTNLPKEVIIVDGDSSDRTYEILKSYSYRFKRIGIRYQPRIKKGNRAVGRNEAIRNATGNIIVCSDAGCILDKEWLKNIVIPFSKSSIDVVSGYYKGRYQNLFQKCLIPYVLVMPDKVNPSKFLPATRSMAFKKIMWERIGGFPEKYSHNEDYAFAQLLKKKGANIFFKEDAIVEWMPPETLSQAFKMFFRFALGDAEAQIFRPKVIFIFLRYILGILLAFYAIIRPVDIMALLVLSLIVFYCIWATVKNYKYVREVRASIILPILQIVSDFAVMIGTFTGILKIWDTKKT